MSRATIRHIFISKGHNFIGHHGKDPDAHPIEERKEVQCVAGKGLVDDRFFDLKENYKGQITFFDWAVFDELKGHYPDKEFPPSAMRRNVLVEGLDLNALIVEEFELQGIRFSGAQHCAPCYWMDQAVGPGAETFLKGRGGLRARILTDGKLTTGPADFRLFHSTGL